MQIDTSKADKLSIILPVQAIRYTVFTYTIISNHIYINEKYFFILTLCLCLLTIFTV